jgi:hypothetical protein
MNGINRSQGEGETRCANTYCGLQEEDCNHPTPLQFYGRVSFYPHMFCQNNLISSFVVINFFQVNIRFVTLKFSFSYKLYKGFIRGKIHKGRYILKKERSKVDVIFKQWILGNHYNIARFFTKSTFLSNLLPNFVHSLLLEDGQFTYLTKNE